MGQALYIAVVGLCVVFLALSGLWAFVVLLRRFEPVPVAARQPSSEVPPEILAVIAAAVAASLKGPHRIHHVRYRRRPAGEGWSTAGRLAVMTSHAPRGTR